MADPDRRDPDAPLTMGERRAPRARRRGPAPITLIISLVVLLAAAAGLAWLYRAGARHSGDAPEPVGAPLSDVRVAAPPQSQTTDQASGLAIYKDGEANSGPPSFVAGPEQPGPRPTAPQNVPPPAATAQPAAPPPEAGRTSAAQGDAIGALIDRTTTPAPRPAPAKAGAARLPASAASEPKPERLARAGGGPEVQIGAFSSQALADRAWNAAAAAAPGSMAGKGKSVTTVERDGQTLYRTAITGFGSRDDAQALCERLRSAGRSCFVR